MASRTAQKLSQGLPTNSFIGLTRQPGAEGAAWPIERARGGVTLDYLEWIERASLTQLTLEHGDLCRWLNLPGNEAWPDQLAEKREKVKAVWQAIQNRQGRCAR